LDFLFRSFLLISRSLQHRLSSFLVWFLPYPPFPPTFGTRATSRFSFFFFFALTIPFPRAGSRIWLFPPCHPSISSFFNMFNLLFMNPRLPSDGGLDVCQVYCLGLFSKVLLQEAFFSFVLSFGKQGDCFLQFSPRETNT